MDKTYILSFILYCNLLFLGGMFVIQGGTYAFTAPAWGFLCDKVIDPRLATLVGSGLITITFIFLGPVRKTK